MEFRQRLELEQSVTAALLVAGSMLLLGSLAIPLLERDPHEVAASSSQVVSVETVTCTGSHHESPTCQHPLPDPNGATE